MKKLLQFPLLLVALFLTSIPISAHDFEVDGIYYNILSDSTVEVTYKGSEYSSYNEYSGAISIPSTVTYNSTIYTITTIGDDAFRESSLSSIDIAQSVVKIGSCAFFQCGLLETIDIPYINSINEIDHYAFVGSGWYENQEDGILYYNMQTKANGLLLRKNFCLGYKGINEPVGSLTLLENTCLIANNAFFRCTGLTGELKIPNSVTSIGRNAFYDCTGLTSVTIGNSVTTIGDCAFYGCSGLTSVTIGNSVTTIGDCAFYGCSGMTSVTIPNSVTEIGSSAFSGCTGLTTITIPNSVTSIGGSTFSGCTGLTTITIPNSVTEIRDYAFSGCSGLNEVNITDLSAWCKIDFDNEYANPLTYARNLILNGSRIINLTIPNDITEIKKYTFSGCHCSSLVIGGSVISIGPNAFRYSSLSNISLPNSLTSISYNAFEYCNNLISCHSHVSQTAITITQLSTSTQYTPYFNCNGNSYSVANKITGLMPNTKYYFYYGLIINGIYCQINSFSFTTLPFNVTLTGTAGVAILSANGSYTQGDATFVGEGLNLGSEVTNFDNKNNVTFENLDPNTSYTVYYGVKIKESSSTYTTSETFTTEALNWTNGRYDATSTTSARLIVETNCDATLGTGYEWRRIDAPDIIASSKVECPVVNGMLVGSLRNLNPDVYYKCRPYYTSASGKTYYGDWVGFYTADANVYFSPEVITYSNVAVNNNSATVKGYALEGTDVITAQGFEYWKTGNTIIPSSADDRMTVNASGIAMSATLANLEYNSTYKYRAFVTTAKGTVYGDEVEFSTGNDPAGIGNIEIDADEFSVTLRENPATGTAWVKISGTAGEEVQYTITSMSGAMIATGTVMLDGEWNAIDLNCSAGMYLLTINDGTQVKTVRLIVK